MNFLRFKTELYILFLYTLLVFSSAAHAEAEKNLIARTDIKAVESWQVSCNYSKSNQKLGCMASLKITQQQTPDNKDKPQQRVVMLWQLLKDQSGTTVTSIQTPTGVLIKPGVLLKASGGTDLALTYHQCDMRGCAAVAKFDENIQQQLIKAKLAEIIIQAIDGKVYTYSFSPKGLDKVLQELTL